MPYLNILLNPITGTSEGEISEVKLVKNLRPHIIRGLSVAAVSSVRRNRSFSNATALSIVDLQVRKMSLLQSMVAAVRGVSIGRVKFFLNRVTTARPQGTLHVATTSPLLNPGQVQPNFRRSRIPRGDLYPLWMVVEGQRLEPLTGQLKVKAIDPVTSLVYQFAKTVSLADPTEITPQVQRMAGRVEINPMDTDGFPDREIEAQYVFVLTDGNGRIYTTEEGFFTVYPPLV